MILYIILGGIAGLVIFSRFEFFLLGAFLGFLLGKINQLSKNVRDLIFEVDYLSTKNKQPDSIQKRAVKVSEQIPVQEAKTDNVRQAYRIPSVAKSPAPEEAKIEATSIPPIVKQQETPSTDRNNINQKPSNEAHRHQESDPFSKLTDYIKDYFSHGNVVVKVGAIILFFGIAFLLKYAAESITVPMEVRLMLVALGAIILLIFGWKLKDKNQGYGLILQGAAVGILYLTLFASFRLYTLVPAMLAFGLLVVFSALAMTLAVLQSSLALAVLSVIGGFLAPVLTSTGSGSHIGLFSYYLILNVGIFAVAWFKSWRILNLTGFVFTFLIGTLWGVTKYQAEHFATTEPFLIIYFVLYSLIALLFASKQKPELKGYVDSTLVFGLPLICFSLQASMVHHFEYGLAWSAFAMGGYYIATAYFVLKGRNEPMKIIAEAHLALGIIFVSLIIPFALDGYWTSASWAIEGAGLVWIGLRQSRWFPKYFGAFLQFAGGIIFLAETGSHQPKTALFDSELLGILFIAIAALFSSFQMWKRKKSLRNVESQSYLLFLVWGLMWWYIGGGTQLIQFLPVYDQTNYLVLAISLSGILWFALEVYYSWRELSHLMWLTLMLLFIVATAHLMVHKHLIDSWQSTVWIFAIASFYACLFYRERGESDSKTLYQPAAIEALHFVKLISIMLFSLVEIRWLTGYLELRGTADGVSIYGILIIFWFALLSRTKLWPINKHFSTYAIGGVNVLMLAGLYWSFVLNFSNPNDSQSLLYLPILNSLDIVQGILLVFMMIPMLRLAKMDLVFTLDGIKLFAIVMGFIWLNVILLRSIHIWYDVPYQFNKLYASILVQTSISIFWTVLGLAGTVIGTRKISRKIWAGGACLLAVVVFKLFTVDLANSSSIERIVSFVVVGLLLLIVGYFSPLPARQNDKQQLEQNNG